MENIHDFLLSRGTWQNTHLLAELLMALLRKLKAHARQIVVIMMPKAGGRKDTPKVISTRHSNDLLERKRDVHIDYHSASDCHGVKMGWRRVNGSRRWWIDGELYRHSQATEAPSKIALFPRRKMFIEPSFFILFYFNFIFINKMTLWVCESSGWWGFVAIFTSTAHQFAGL